VLARHALDGYDDRLPHTHRRRVALGHGEPEPEWVELDERDHRSPGGEVLSDRGSALAHRAFDRRGDHGVRALLPRQLQLGAPLKEHGLPIANLLDAVLIAGFGHAQRRHRRVDLRLRDQLPLPELLRPLACQPRLVKHRARLAHEGGVLGIHAVVRALPRESEPGARLLQRRHRLVHAELSVGGVERATVWSRRTRLPRSTSSSPIRPATLVPSTTCSSAARVPVALTLRSTTSSAAGTTRTCRGCWRWVSEGGAAAGPGLRSQPSGIRATAMSASHDNMRLAPATGGINPILHPA